MARNTDEAIEKMEKAVDFADIFEIRLDVMESFDLEMVIRSSPLPVLVTYRSVKEGGKGKADYTIRTHHLLKAIEAGADFVDVEFTMPLGFRELIWEHRRKTKLVLSIHLMNRTPSREDLEKTFRKMAATGADMVKIVTRARSWEDNWNVLSLIPLAEKTGVNITAFCLGSMGVISRVACPLMGGSLTFASLEQGEESAPGQIPAQEMNRILEILSP
jgi:3-dehydroquinate dehydratase type I